MIDPLTVTVRDLKKTRAFYKKALAPLGCSLKMAPDRSRLSQRSEEALSGVFSLDRADPRRYTPARAT